MKRRFLSVLALLLLMIGTPLVIAAQDSKSVWKLTEDLRGTDLGLDIKYPAGWTYQATEGSGIYLAEDKADFKPITDDDPTTIAKGLTIQLIGTKTVELMSVLGDKVTLDDLADYVVKSRGVTEKEPRVDVPVMTRRARIVLGVDQADQGWILAFWHQGEYYMGAFLTAPSYDETLKVAFSFGQMLGIITPLDALPLGDGAMNFSKTQSVMSYPDGWVLNPDKPGTIYELESDLKIDTPEGLTIRTTEVTLEGAKLDKDTTVSHLVDNIIASLGLKEPVEREEFILLGQPAITIRGQVSEKQYAIATQTIVDGYVLQIAVIGPDEETVTKFEPTFISMLQSWHVEKSS
jgi:hypothetical protein